MGSEVENGRIEPVGPIDLKVDDLPIEGSFQFARSEFGEIGNVPGAVGPGAGEAELVDHDGVPAAGEEKNRVGGVDDGIVQAVVGIAGEFRNVGFGGEGAVAALELQDSGGKFAVPIVGAEVLEAGSQTHAFKAIERVAHVHPVGQDLESAVSLFDPGEAADQGRAEGLASDSLAMGCIEVIVGDEERSDAGGRHGNG